MQLGRFLKSLNRWESPAASDDARRLPVSASVRKPNAPQIFLWRLTGHPAEETQRSWRAVVLPQACEAVFYDPGNLLVRQDSYLEKWFRNGLEWQRKKGSPGV